MRVRVDLHDLGIGLEIAALGRKMPEPSADHEIARKGAGDVEGQGVAVEEALAHRLVASNAAALLREHLPRVAA